MFLKTQAPAQKAATVKDVATRQITDLLAGADVQVGGNRPWDIQVHNQQFYRRVLTNPALGLGESYLDGWWDCERIDQFFFKILSARLDRRVRPGLKFIVQKLLSYILNRQSRTGSEKIARRHYNLSVELYRAFLDPYNQYTCGYFKDTEDLNTAQEQKLDLICRKFAISPSDHVLDIGCGWGGFARFAAERYGCHVTGITISTEQLDYATEFCTGLPVTILMLDYRDLNTTEYLRRYDKVLICGMIEHVGFKNYRKIMQIVSRCLKDDGLFLLHTIGNDISSPINHNLWMEKYIFPNSAIPSMSQLSDGAEGLFVIEDVHNFSAHYDKTLMGWWENFRKNWGKISLKFDERFYRMWKYYLLSCAGSFRARHSQLWQIVFSKNGVPGGYVATR